jgi:hypothetical protein
LFTDQILLRFLRRLTPYEHFAQSGEQVPGPAGYV